MGGRRKGGGRVRRGGRTVRALALVCVLAAFAGGAYLAGGFLRFAQDVASLTPPASLGEADGIVVLTGGSDRISRAVELLQREEGQRLLISGVNPDTGVASLSRLTGTDRSLFDCCVDLDYDALDTAGNAEMTARWAQAHGLHRIVLVTSDYHIPRSLIELRAAAGDLEVVPYPVSPDKLWQDGRPTRLGLRLLLTEYAKVIAARLRLTLGVEAGLAASGATREAGLDAGASRRTGPGL